jgi:hypothetical protein
VLSTQTLLEDARKSASALSHDKRRLAQMLQEMDERYKVAATALTRTNRELVLATGAIAKAQTEHEARSISTEAEMARMHEVATKERSLLVQAALSSLSHLRAHLSQTLSGLHVVNPPEEPDPSAAWRQWKSRWGVTAQDGADAMVVTRLAPPSRPPLCVRPLSASPRRPPSARLGSRVPSSRVATRGNAPHRAPPPPSARRHTTVWAGA